MLSKVNRLKGKINFDLIFKKGEKKYSPYFVVYRYLNPANTGLAAQIGIVTSKKVGGAVQRNRARRKISAALININLLTNLTPGFQYVIIALKGVSAVEVNLLQASLSTMLK